MIKKIVDYKTAQQKPKVTNRILVSPIIDLSKVYLFNEKPRFSVSIATARSRIITLTASIAKVTAARDVGSHSWKVRPPGINT